MARKTAMKKEPTVSVALPNSEKKRLGMPTTPDRQKPQRLSPGVYRGPKGQLQTSSGRQLPRPATPPGQAGRLVDAMNQAPQQGQIATRPPAPLGTMPGNAATEANNLAQGSQPIGTQPGFMSQITPEQWQQLQQYFKPASRPQMEQMDQMQYPFSMPSMPQQSVNTGIYGGPSPAFDAQQQGMSQAMSQANLNPQQYQPMMPYRR